MYGVEKGFLRTSPRELQCRWNISVPGGAVSAQINTAGGRSPSRQRACDVSKSHMAAELGDWW